MARRVRSRRGSIRATGWDAYATPVPGDVYEAIRELNLPIRRVANNEVEMPCPEHFNRTGKEDRHPSFSVNEDGGYFNCFSCGYRGPFVLLVKDALGVEWEEAVAWVRQRGGIERVRRSIGSDIDDLVAHPEETDTTKIMNEASLALFEDPPKEQLDDRGLFLESVRAYGIRWDTKRDLWIAPIREPDTGTLLGWQEKNARYFRNRPYNVQKSLCVFGLDAWDDGRPGVLVESPLDTAYINTHLPANGLSGYGAGVSDAQMRLIHDYTDVLYVALDNDRDGHLASERLRSEWGHKMRLKFWDYTKTAAKDPGEQTPSELERSFANAFSSIVSRF